MAYETGRANGSSNILRTLKDFWLRREAYFGVGAKSLNHGLLRARHLISHNGPIARAASKLAKRVPLAGYLSSTLMRRIFAYNLVGLAIMVLGVLYLILNSGWLINAHREALTAQAQIIGAAIASDAKVVTGRIVLDRDKLPTPKGTRAPFRDDAFAAYELPLKPEQIAPVLTRLTKPINKTRARVYAPDTTLIVDTDRLLRRGQVVKARPAKNLKQPNTTNFWTWLRHLLIEQELPVYKELDAAAGAAYPEVLQALQGETNGMLLLSKKGEQIVSVAVPIERNKVVLGALLLSTEPGVIDKVLDQASGFVSPLVIVSLIATFVTSLLLSGTIAGPMQRLSKIAEGVSRDINAPQDMPDLVARRDEVGQMARAFRTMTASLFRRIEQSDNFAADVAHELKNPLTAASSTAQSLEYARTDEDRETLVHDIQSELRRLDKLITDVSIASRTEADLARLTFGPVDLGKVLETVSSALEHKANKFNCKLHYSSDGMRKMVHGHDGRLAQVITNLIDNAISFSPEGGRVRVNSSSSNGQIKITVEDEGPGVPDDKLETIFDRFYTYRPTANSSRGNNSGLGLSICRAIMSAHGGEIRAENNIDAKGRPTGARFVVTLPELGLAAAGGVRAGGSSD